MIRRKHHTSETASKRNNEGHAARARVCDRSRFETCTEHLVQRQVVGENIGLPSAELLASASTSSIVQRLGMRSELSDFGFGTLHGEEGLAQE